MKKLGFGMMRLPQLKADDYSLVDVEQVKKMADEFLAKGFTYFDTAYPYHLGKSEEAFRKAVAKRYPRTAYTITDKMPCWLIHSAADMQRIFDEQLQRCGVDYFDYYWIHAIHSVASLIQANTKIISLRCCSSSISAMFIKRNITNI